jgi:hypothetical protein
LKEQFIDVIKNQNNSLNELFNSFEIKEKKVLKVISNNF